MGSIVLLDENTINKIAAGEVVDRPSSIVKELVENSIDAHAKNITIEIKKGGIGYIKITDDGDGFRADDTEIAFERHATSKIRKEADILKITSMGFRGEALASIAAISKVTLITKHKDEQLGSKIVVEGGNIISNCVAPSNKGSTIIIKDVFYNTPARYKFLKKDYTEAGYIEDVVTRIALANPDITIKYINSGKQIISTPGDGKLESVIYSIFGRDIYTSILPLEYEYQDIKVKGIIGLPVISRSNRNNEFTYINSRYVKDKTIMSAIEKGYDEKLMINKFPFAVINIEMSPETLDVNVHPAKLEVKFENETKVFEAVFYAVRNTLEQNSRKTSPFTILKDKKEKYESSSSVDVNTAMNNNPQDSVDNVDNVNHDTDVSRVEIEEFVTPPKESTDGNLSKKESMVASEYLNVVKQIDGAKGDILSKTAINEVKEDKQEYIAHGAENFASFDAPTEEYEEINIVNEEAKKKNIYKYIGCAFNTYIIIEIDGKLYFIDQHAAHERYLYDKIKKYFEEKKKDSQMLLVPIIIELRNNEMQVVRDNAEYFEKYGYIFEEFSSNSYKISGVPNIGDIKLDYKEMFLDIVDEFITKSRSQRQQNEYRFLATIACKAAVKGNIPITQTEQIKLIDGMLESDTPFTCPHGRPTAINFTRYELEKKFGRKV